MLFIYGVDELFAPAEWFPGGHLAELIDPGSSEIRTRLGKIRRSKKSNTQSALRRVIERPHSFTIEDRTFELSLGDLFRAGFIIPELMAQAIARARRTRSASPEEFAQLEEARRRAVDFVQNHMTKVFGTLGCQFNRIADQYLRIDENIFWYLTETNLRYPDRAAFKVVIYRKEPAPIYVAVSDGIRKAYRCERARG